MNIIQRLRCLAIASGIAVSAASAFGAISVPSSAILTWNKEQDEIVANGAGWETTATKLESSVKQDEDGSFFEYTYHWTTADKDLSHIIIQVSAGATASEFEVIGDGIEKWTIGTFDQNSDGNSNPGIPGAIYGLKVDLSEDSTDFKFTIRTLRGPVWGDFYAKDGKDSKGTEEVYAYNSGFSDPDPTDALGDGRHIIVPNGVVPEPSTYFAAALLGLPALIGLSRGLRRKNA
jgi:hypothetical protein